MPRVRLSSQRLWLSVEKPSPAFFHEVDRRKRPRRGPGWRFLSQHPPHPAADHFIHSLLAEAVDRGDAAAIAASVEAGADVNAYGKGGYRLLYWVMARGKAEGFEQLLKHGARLDDDYRDSSYLRDPSYNRAVIEKMLENKDQRFLEAALRQGLDPDYSLAKDFHRPLLFIAINSHSYAAIETLLNAGAAINGQDDSGYTPMFRAMLGNEYNAARILLDRGADPTIMSKQGHDFVWGLKQFGSRGVLPDCRESFEVVVSELIRRGLLTRQDIIDGNKLPESAPKNEPGITVIEHSPDSEAGQAILELDRREREASGRENR
jgi:ankyrin repeat protein